MSLKEELNELLSNNLIESYEILSEDLLIENNAFGIRLNGKEEIYELSEEALIQEVWNRIGINKAPNSTMDNIPPSKSGIPQTIWIDPSGKNRNVEHNLPRDKAFVPGENSFVYAYIDRSMSEKEINEIADGSKRKKKALKNLLLFNELNRDILLKYWNLSDEERSIQFNELKNKIKAVRKHYGS